MSQFAEAAMLELRPNCECYDRNLPPEATNAAIFF